MDFPLRKQARAKWHDYNGATYFITVCTQNRNKYLGTIRDKNMTLSPIGTFLYHNLSTLKSHHENVEIPYWVIMPNHFHAIITIDNIIPDSIISLPVTTNEVNRKKTSEGMSRDILPVIIGGIKAAVTRYARNNNIEFSWQSGYHDRIIRNIREYNLISEYIQNNHIRWEDDCFFK